MKDSRPKLKASRQKGTRISKFNMEQYNSCEKRDSRLEICVFSRLTSYPIRARCAFPFPYRNLLLWRRVDSIINSKIEVQIIAFCRRFAVFFQNATIGYLK